MAGINRSVDSDWLVFPDGEALAAAVADHVEQALENAIDKHGEFHLVLPGGTTPRGLLLRLRERQLPWQAIHLYLTDERCLPVGHKQRNDHMLDELLLPYIAMPSSNLHRIAAEQGPEVGKQQYEQLLQTVPPFDLVILGMGEDGHTASLFPASPQLQDDAHVVAVYAAPKPPPERISIGFSRLLLANERIVMAAGEGKSKVIRQIKEGKEFPITQAKPSVWYLDAAAG